MSILTKKLELHLPLILDRLQPSERVILLTTAIAVGAGTSIGAVLFIRRIAFIQQAFFETGAAAFGFLGRGIFILAPTLGGLLAGPIIAYFAKEAKGQGVPEVMQAIALRGGRIWPRVVIAKVIASALCIGSGGSAGREGPIVQAGSVLGSTIGQWLRLSEARIRNLVACGAAAGIAATFEGALQGKLPLTLLLALVFLKPLATSLSLGSGNSGGVFAPALFIGAALGGAFGCIVEYLAPGRSRCISADW